MACAVGVLAASIAGCGGGEDLTSGESSGTYKVDVVGASFPTLQHLAASSRFAVDVRNAGDRDIGNVSVTLDGFSSVSTQPGVADPTRPIWVVDDGPRGGTTTYVNTWALAASPPARPATSSGASPPSSPASTASATASTPASRARGRRSPPTTARRRAR